MEAVVHALYEKIERHYMGLAEAGLMDILYLEPTTIEGFDLLEWNKNAPEDHHIDVFVFIDKRTKGLPMVMARTRLFGGYGCTTNAQ